MAKPWYSRHHLRTELRRVVDSHFRDLRVALRKVAWLATRGKSAKAVRQVMRGDLDGYYASDGTLTLVGTKALLVLLSKALLRDPDSLKRSAISLRPHGVWGQEILKLGTGRTGIEFTSLPFFTDVLGIELAWIAVAKADEAAVRATRLLGFLTGAPLSSTAEAYLQRVAQCYIWGFDTEAVMLARSVLDSALAEKVDQRVSEAVEKNPGFFASARWESLRKGYPPDLNGRIAVAQVLGLFSGEVAKMATYLRIRGNDAVHNNIRSDPFDTIQNLVGVLNALL